MASRISLEKADGAPGSVLLDPCGRADRVDPTRWGTRHRRRGPRGPSRHATASGKTLVPIGLSEQVSYPVPTTEPSSVVRRYTISRSTSWLLTGWPVAASHISVPWTSCLNVGISAPPNAARTIQLSATLRTVRKATGGRCAGRVPVSRLRDRVQRTSAKPALKSRSLKDGTCYVARK